MTTIEKSLPDLVRNLPPELEVEVRDFIEFLLEKRRRAELERHAVARGWPSGYFEEVIGSLPDFPDVDGDMDGIDSSLDRSDEDLRFDLPEEPDRQGAAE